MWISVRPNELRSCPGIDSTGSYKLRDSLRTLRLGSTVYTRDIQNSIYSSDSLIVIIGLMGQVPNELHDKNIIETSCCIITVSSVTGLMN
jgi:hypothetical protein